MAVQQLLAAYSAAAPSPGAHVYWRIDITKTRTPDSFFAQLAGIQLRLASGGSQQATGGTASASTFFSSTPPEDAFDGNAATWWASESGFGSPQWIQYQLPSALEIRAVLLQSGDNSTRALRAPEDFTIQYSDDGVSFTTAFSVVGAPAWADSESREYTY
jgi:hypothetical protein